MDHTPDGPMTRDLTHTADRPPNMLEQTNLLPINSPFSAEAQLQLPTDHTSVVFTELKVTSAGLCKASSWDCTGKPVFVSLSAASSMPYTLTSGHEWAQNIIPAYSAPNTLTSGLAFCRRASQQVVSSDDESDSLSESSDGDADDFTAIQSAVMDVGSGGDVAIACHGGPGEDGVESTETEQQHEDASVADMWRLMARLGLLMNEQANRPARAPAMSSFDLAGVADLVKSGRARRIVCACGAGISVSAGIPDFRSPGTGLYSQLAKYNLPFPEAVFSIKFFQSDPMPFYTLAKELFPGNFQPTPTHHFMKLLHDKGLLLRCFTQNIDSLETAAGLPKEKVIAAHGNFDTAHCISCDRQHPVHVVKEHIEARTVLRCDCGGLVKPGIVFFGESLPVSFHEGVHGDLPECDLLIVLGTSLVVQPFASLVGLVEDTTPRLLINREMVGEDYFELGANNVRDAVFLGDCDEGVQQLAALLGWSEELQVLVDGAGASAVPAAAQ